jgi:beta-fructofuranosidase
MAFVLPDYWVWDFWLADDGLVFHLFYLRAPKSLGNPSLRHRNAQIGHATSRDLVLWTDLGPVLGPGGPGDFDETATWTGSVVKGPDGVWRLFYTGSRFLSGDSDSNIETVGLAKSTDLHTWIKEPTPLVSVDARWYERLGDCRWTEETWRDPWVFADPEGDGWRMILTARANVGDGIDRGVIAHARSSDLDGWEVLPPLSAPGCGFQHLEVPQIATIHGRHALLFSCASSGLAGARAAAGESGGVWALEVASPVGPYEIGNAAVVAGEPLYSGRLIQTRSGDWVLLAIENSTVDNEFTGGLSQPIPVRWAADGGPIECCETEALA